MGPISLSPRWIDLESIILFPLAMSSSSTPPQYATPSPLVEWTSLVSRSIAAWDDIVTDNRATPKNPPSFVLQEYHSLDDFLSHCGSPLMFWFFQRRSAFMSQKNFKKWSSNELDDYVLLPALPGFVLRRDCFFVSHFWRTKNHPDPDGEYLRLNQAELQSQTWSYIWVDWTCMPQSPRSSSEKAYFRRCLQTMSGIVRNCAFIYFYPPFEPRLWILYEITEYVLTCSGGIPMTSDNEVFVQHMDEMLKAGVQTTLAKHGYRCSYDRDRRYLIAWLELLVLLRRLHFKVDGIRVIMDNMTWRPACGIQIYREAELHRFKGILVVNGKTHTFSPFPQLVSAKHSNMELANGKH
jgi:hypothetical protein